MVVPQYAHLWCCIGCVLVVLPVGVMYVVVGFHLEAGWYDGMWEPMGDLPRYLAGLVAVAALGALSTRPRTGGALAMVAALMCLGVVVEGARAAGELWAEGPLPRAFAAPVIAVALWLVPAAPLAVAGWLVIRAATRSAGATSLGQAHAVAAAGHRANVLACAGCELAFVFSGIWFIGNGLNAEAGYVLPRSYAVVPPMFFMCGLMTVLALAVIPTRPHIGALLLVFAALACLPSTFVRGEVDVLAVASWLLAALPLLAASVLIERSGGQRRRIMRPL